MAFGSNTQSQLSVAPNVEAKERPVTPENWFTTKTRAEAFFQAHSAHVATVLALYAGLRILLLAAAFPNGNYATNERFHFASILMYAQGHLPGRELQMMDPGFLRNLLLYWSPEYALSAAEMQHENIDQPLCRLTHEEQDTALSRGYFGNLLKRWVTKGNYEGQAPPMYYLVAAAWYRVGAALGIGNWHLFYWVRFLNSILYGLFVWSCFRFVQTVYADRPFLHLAVPALLAVFPQDVFFGMNRDVLLPLMGALALLAMVKALDLRSGRSRFLLLSSFLVGLAFLTEVSSFVLYFALAAALWAWLRESGASRPHKVWVLIACTLAAGLLPMLWMTRNYLVMGALTGSREKIHFLTWTVKPLSQIFDHPMFSWHGLASFVIGLTRGFWHGEDNWHGLSMRSVWADRFYVVSSVLFVLVFTFDLVIRRRKIRRLQLLVGAQSLLLVGCSVLFLAFLSLLFDFHEGIYPSRAFPYFVSGRIIMGVLLPFVLIYAAGLELVAIRFHKWVSPIACLGMVLLLVTVSEILVRGPVFSSPFNLFHLWGKC